MNAIDKFGAWCAFFAAGMPQTKGSWKIVSGRRGVGRLVPDNDAEPAWAEAVAWAAKAQMRGRAPTLERVRVAVEFVLAPPLNRCKTNRRDLDKLARSVLDAMQGIVYVDDEQVGVMTLEKRTSAVASEIGARVTVGIVP